MEIPLQLRLLSEDNERDRSREHLIPGQTYPVNASLLGKLGVVPSSRRGENPLIELLRAAATQTLHGIKKKTPPQLGEDFDVFSFNFFDILEDFDDNTPLSQYSLIPLEQPRAKAGSILDAPVKPGTKIPKPATGSSSPPTRGRSETPGALKVRAIRARRKAAMSDLGGLSIDPAALLAAGEDPALVASLTDHAVRTKEVAIRGGINSVKTILGDERKAVRRAAIEKRRAERAKKASPFTPRATTGGASEPSPPTPVLRAKKPAAPPRPDAKFQTVLANKAENDRKKQAGK